jgi:hypothetical protein
MKRLLTYVLILGGVVLASLSGCQKDLVAPSETKTYNIFENVGANPYIQNLVSYLKEKGDTASFRRTFALEYGIPLWSKATVLKQGETTTMLVPLKDCDANFLSGIWVFEVKNGNIRYGVTRNEQCMPYYEKLKPFFNLLNQELFGIREKGVTYSRVGGMLKGYDLEQKENCVMGCAGGDDANLGCSQHCWTTWDFIFIDDTGGGGSYNNGSGVNLGGGGTTTNPTPEPEPTPEVCKDTSFVNTKADCVFEKLVGATSTTIYNPNTVVGKLLKDYWGKTTAGAHNLKFVVSPQKDLVNSGTHAQCETDKDYKSMDVTIRISREFMESCTNVELARTLIHESIHAEIYVRVKGFGAGISSDAEFAELFEKYKSLGTEKDHNIMAESDYVNLIAQGLKAYHDAGYMADFDANVTRSGNNFDYNQFYNMEAWYGLDNTKAFNSNKQNTTWSEDYLNYTKAPGKYIDTKDCK